MEYFHYFILLGVGCFIGICFGAWATYKILKSEIYEYVKASRKDQEVINTLNKQLLDSPV